MLFSSCLHLALSGVLFLATGSIALADPAPKPDADGPYVPPGYVKVFADEMDSSSLDIGKWWTRYIYDNGKLATLNDERQKYAENDNHIMTGSTLELTARLKPTSNPRFQYESGMIRSKKTFKYGYFESRIKMPRGLGVWPAFWLNSDSDAEGKTGWPPEIDILEFPLNGKEERSNMIHIAAHARPKKGEPNPWENALISHCPEFKSKSGGNGYYHAPFDFYDDYHVFAALWDRDDTVEFFVDGKSIVKMKYKWVLGSGKEAPNAHVLLNLAIGGGWAGRHGIDDSAFPQSMSIDYVRVYQREDDQRVGQSTIGHDLLKPGTPARE